jgi:predicted ferric reductase
MTATMATQRQPMAPHRRRRPVTPPWWRRATGTACAVTAAFVVWLWLHGHGLQSLTGPRGEVLTSLGRITGLVAADLLLIQVFLMARVPMIERSYGQDELARRHRQVGFWSFNLLLAHIVLVTVGYTLSGHMSLLHEAWTLVSSYAGMLLAVAATVALTAVVVTSVRVARRTLRYESWHLIHLYAYLGVGLSIPHELWTGTDLTGSPLARTWWIAAYALAAGAVVVYRVGLPVWRTARHQLRVAGVHRESADVVTVRVSGRGLHRLPVRAGQYFVWRFMDGDGWSHGHPFSLSAAPRHDELQITAKDLGDGSRRLAELRPGTRVLIEGPYGRMTGERRTRTKLVMFACGIGVTPLRALLEEMPYARGDATLIYRAHSAHDLVFRAQLESVAVTRGITIVYVFGPRTRTRSSWQPVSETPLPDDRAVLRLVPDLVTRDVYVCGPDAWMDAMSEAVLRAGVPSWQLHQERFSW